MLGGDDDGGGGGGNGGGGYTGSGSEGATGMGAAPADVKSHTPPPPPLSLRSGDDGTKAAAIGNGMDDASPTGVQQQATATASVIAAAALPVSVPPAPALPGGIIPLPPTAGAVEDGAHAGGEGKVRAASPVATARCAAVPVVGNRGVGSLEATPLAAVAIPTEPPPHGPGTKAVRSAGAAGAPLAAGAAIASPMGRPSDGGGAVCAAVTTAATATSPAVAAALYKSRGNAHFAAGAYDKAVAAYTAGLEAEPRNVNLLSNRSAAHLKLLNYADAETDGRAAIVVDPTWPKGWWRVGVAQLEAARPVEAVATFDAALAACGPRDPNLRSARRRALDAVEAQAHLAAIAAPATACSGGDGHPEKLPHPGAALAQNMGAANASAEATVVQARSRGEVGGAPGSSADGPNCVRRPPKAVTSRDAGGYGGVAGRPAALVAAEEIPRVLSAQNYYAVLGVAITASAGEIKRRYYALARVLHPDKCRQPMGGEAMRDVSMAYTTLSSPVKRTLYDRYMRDVMKTDGRSARTTVASAAAGNPEGNATIVADGGGNTTSSRPTQSYSEWEAAQSAAVDLPPWLVCILGVNGGGCCVAAVVLLALLPLAIVAVVVTGVAWVVWAPLRAWRRWRQGAEAAAEADRRAAAKADEVLQDVMTGHV